MPKSLFFSSCLALLLADQCVCVYVCVCMCVCMCVCSRQVFLFHNLSWWQQWQHNYHATNRITHARSCLLEDVFSQTMQNILKLN